MKTVHAKISVSLVFHVEDNDDPNDFLNEMDYQFFQENGDPISSTIVNQEFEIVEE